MAICSWLFRGAMIVAAVVAGGCASVPLTTIAKLWAFEFDSADPAVLRAAVRIPASLAPRPGGVVLTVVTWQDGETARHQHPFILEEAVEPGEAAPLASYRRTGDRIAVYRVSAADVVVMRRLLADHREKKRTSSARQSSTIDIKADACRVGALPEGPILSSTFLKLDERDGYLPLLVDLDLRQEIGAAEFAKAVPPCASP